MSKYLFFKDKICIFLLEGVYKSVVEIFEVNGYINIEYLKMFLFEDELIEKIKDVYFIGICFCMYISEKVVEVVSKLVVIGCFCIGIN